MPERRSKRPERAKSSFKVVTVNISYERNGSLRSGDADLEASKDDSVEFEPYSVKIEGRRPNDSDNPILGIGKQATAQPSTTRSNAMNANAAAWAYIRCAMLFFVALLITWVSRLYLLSHADFCLQQIFCAAWNTNFSKLYCPILANNAQLSRCPAPSIVCTPSSTGILRTSVSTTVLRLSCRSWASGTASSTLRSAGRPARSSAATYCSSTRRILHRKRS